MSRNSCWIIVHVEVHLMWADAVQQSSMRYSSELLKENTKPPKHVCSKCHISSVQYQVAANFTGQHDKVSPSKMALLDEKIHRRQRWIAAMCVVNCNIHQLRGISPCFNVEISAMWTFPPEVIVQTHRYRQRQRWHLQGILNQRPDL